MPEIRIARDIELRPPIVEYGIPQLSQALIDIPDVVEDPAVFHPALMSDPLEPEQRLEVQLTGCLSVGFGNCSAKVALTLFEEEEKIAV